MYTLSPQFDNNKAQYDYYNAVGLLHDECLYLHNEHKLMQFDISTIKRLYLKKERDLSGNYKLLLSSLLLLLPLLSATLYDRVHLWGFLPAVLLLCYGLSKKKFTYIIVLFTSNSQLLNIAVSEDHKDEACELLSVAKSKIKTNKHYLKVG